jgi:pilus assembly protein CpaD
MTIMSKIMSQTATKAGRKLAVATAVLSIGFGLSGCIADNRSVDSIHQPVVERTNYTFDLATGPGGLSTIERNRLAGWFEAMDLRYGDRISIDDPLGSGATRASVQEVASRYGVLLSNEAPVTQGYVSAGTTRVVVSRSSASVPGCPDWKTKSDFNPNSATTSNYGCATNSNLASMVADPEHLVRGASTTGDTVVMSSNKAINAYREAKTTGSGDLKSSGTGGK